MDNIPAWLALTVSCCLALIVAILTYFIVVPIQRRKITKQLVANQPVKFQFADSNGGEMRKRLEIKDFFVLLN